MTAYDSLILKGKREGRQEGLQEGLEKVKAEKFQATKNLILEGSTNEFICKVLNVSNEFVEQVRSEVKR